MKKPTNKPEAKTQTVGNNVGFQKVTATALHLEDHFNGEVLKAKDTTGKVIIIQAGAHEGR